MKKVLIIMAAFAAIAVGCGSNEQKGGQAEQTPAAKDPEVEKGLQLVANSDCLGCHQIKEESTGPAYMAIADRYRNKGDVTDTLAQKIIQGGTGNWGSIPMTPHPSLSQEDARTMVKYILSLKE
jgi:cytochrome c